MVIGIVIGSGVFIKGGKVLSLTGGNLLQGIAVVGIVGLICIICSLVFATLGSKYEKVNGVVDYAELALGSKYAYYVGWFMTTIYTPALASMLAFFSAMMFLQLFGISSIDFANGQVNAVAIGVGAGFLMIGYGINALSPKIAGKLQVGMTVIKLIPLILMGVAGTIAGLVNGTTLEVLDYVNSADYVAVDGTGFFKAIVGFAFAYEGWILATSINAELKDSKKNLPRALVIGALVTIVLYALYIWAMSIVGDVNTIISTWPFGESLPRLAFSKLFGNVIGTIVYVFITISCLGTMNGLIMASCRSMYSVSARGMGPQPSFFGHIDDQNNFAIKSSIVGMMLRRLLVCLDGHDVDGRPRPVRRGALKRVVCLGAGRDRHHLSVSDVHPHDDRTHGQGKGAWPCQALCASHSGRCLLPVLLLRDLDGLRLEAVRRLPDLLRGRHVHRLSV